MASAQAWRDHPHQTLVFHDLSPNPVNAFQDLFRAAKSSKAVQDVLDACTRALKVEYITLTRSDRQRIPTFLSFHDLVRLMDAGLADDVVSCTVLSTAAQLACFAL